MALLRDPDARSAPRARTRLRAGKLVAENGRLWGECRILDRSAIGARLQMQDPAALPVALLLYDDETRDLVRVTLVWRRGGLVGVRFVGRVSGASSRALRRTLGAQFYAAR